MFRVKKGIKRNYQEQGYIYFISLNYYGLNEEGQEKINNLCIVCGGEHYQALFDFVTSDKSATEICLNHAIGKSTLYRIVRAYYEGFEIG